MGEHPPTAVLLGDIGELVAGADVDGPLVGGAVVDSVVGRTVGGVVETTKKTKTKKPLYMHCGCHFTW